MTISRRTCLAMGLALGLSACFGAGPEAAVEGFYQAVAQGDADKAMGFLALESVSANEMLMVKPKIQMLVATGKAKIDANGGLKGVKITDQQPQGENALHVRLEITFQNGKTDSDTMNLVKEKDGWKIKL
ncbi:MAG: DUF4878 domain-containing protein [Burkholderiales bacterium]|nr:DUF4878 domain-containing protein [Burkholderiales bacterium]